MCYRDAWKSVEGISKEDAYKKYVDKLLEVRHRSQRVMEYTDYIMLSPGAQESRQ